MSSPRFILFLVAVFANTISAETWQNATGYIPDHGSVLTQGIAARNITVTGEIRQNEQVIKIDLVPRESLIKLTLGCNHTNNEYTTAFLRRADTKEVVVSTSSECAVNGSTLGLTYTTHARVFSSYTEDVVYELVVSGPKECFYEARYEISKVRMPLNENTTHHIRPGTVSIHTFVLPNFDTVNYRYVDVTVAGRDAEKSVVGKMIVTQSQEELKSFLVSPNTSTPASLRLSFSNFGRVVLSDISKPALSGNIWIIGLVLFDGLRSKTIDLTVEYNTDYEYVSLILILTVVSCFGVVLPIFSRYIFNYLNADRKVTFSAWLQVVVNWFYRGPKGLSYLTGFLAWMLLVSAFQVVNAKWSEMIEKGDRDVCFYNEKCYKPYLGYYDVSVNGIASNMCFMVHGAILIISVSLCETSCYSLNHKNYDYSIPYSFGMAFIFEGFGSLLYHICPSQIIFQFDTLFMFVISQYVIAALVDGHAVRKTYIDKVSSDKLVKRTVKSIRSPKLFLFFLGPAYGFNFLGNLHYIEPLPAAISSVFFIALGLWVLSILTWAAYKADLLPNTYFRPAKILFAEDGEALDVSEGMGKKRCLTIFLFSGYCVVVFIGYCLVCTGKLVISIFILGELIIALLIMTTAAFVDLLKDLWSTIAHGTTEYSRKMRCLIPTGVILYLGCGLAIMAVSLFFFVILEVTDKSLPAWESRNLNQPCILQNFYDAHDLWHFFASHALLMIVLVVMQMSKPCRDCYLKYKVIQEIGKNEGNKVDVVKIKGDFLQEPVVLKVIPLA